MISILINAESYYKEQWQLKLLSVLEMMREHGFESLVCPLV